MLGAERRLDEETLLDRAIVLANAETFEAVIARLDAPHDANAPSMGIGPEPHPNRPAAFARPIRGSSAASSGP